MNGYGFNAVQAHFFQKGIQFVGQITRSNIYLTLAYEAILPFAIFAHSMKALFKIFFVLIVSTVFSVELAVGQGTDSTYYGLSIKKSAEPIVLDGEINELAWQEAEIARDFVQQFPYDTAQAVTRTEVRVTYNDQFLYISAVCWDDEAGDYVVQSLKRDFSYPITDAFAVFIDPFSDKTNGFNFTVSPLGVQREGLLENGGSFGVSTQWDNKWFSEVKEYDDKWVVEMAIPFKTLRFNAGNDQWRINFSRNNLKCNENSCWVPIPRAYNVATMAFSGEMKFEEAPKKSGPNVSIIPYVLGRYTADYENKVDNFKPNVGLDAKVAVTSSLNLDLTLNPDFSQVEVDRQVTNLSRFSLFFPERRQFFIENSDLFAQNGFSKIRPFFSRNIGLYRGSAVPILGGARLSGKLNQNWRIGAMSMQTEGVGSLNLQGQNYAVAAVQRKVFERSSVGLMWVNRQGFDGGKMDSRDFNRVLGFDYFYNSKNNKLRGKGFYHRSFGPEKLGKESANAIWMMYNDQNFRLMYNHEWVDENYNAEVGFVPRHKYFRLEPSANVNFYPKKGIVQRHGPTSYASWYWDNQSWQSIERHSVVGYNVILQNRSQFSVSGTESYIYLQNEFDPTNTGANPITDSVGYNYRYLSANYSSDYRKKFNVEVGGQHGCYFNGTRSNIGGEINFRTQPWGIFSLRFDQNYISLPDTNVWLSLISPRVELSFTKNLFFTTFFQYNSQSNNFNINARMQWRFKPMSDLFIVLTDNYNTPNIGIKNRALVLKLNYWFSL